MTYGLNPKLYIEEGPTIQADRASRRSSARAFEAWRAMGEAQRLEAVEQTLAATANENLSDGYPAAL